MTTVVANIDREYDRRNQQACTVMFIAYWSANSTAPLPFVSPRWIDQVGVASAFGTSLRGMRKHELDTSIRSVFYDSYDYRDILEMLQTVKFSIGSCTTRKEICSIANLVLGLVRFGTPSRQARNVRNSGRSSRNMS